MAKAKSTTATAQQQTATPAQEPVAQTASATPAPAEKVSKKSSKATAQQTATATETAAPAPVAQTATATATATSSSASSEKAKKVSKKASTTTESASSSSPAQTATPAPAQVVEQTSTPATTEKKARASKKSASTTESSTSSSAPAQTATPAPAQQASTESNNNEGDANAENVSVADRIGQLVAANEQFANTQREISTLLKKAVKLYSKESRELAVANARSHAKKAKREGDENREPCGIRAPTLISDSMCSFLGCPTGTRLPRTDVTKLVTDYIKKNDLQIQTNKRFFAPDAKLGAILGPLQQKDKEMGYGYFNLQRYLSPHFLKATTTSTVAVAAQ
jgi:chromatin remodeling complex protein RSC6